ncbi:MAG: tetratricopeptide repeat protein, partial [Chloroflexi bacterium]|nr:tetratricopeptide repeat protein [Chloroflexota bacterium]
MAKHGKKKHQKQRGPVKLAGGPPRAMGASPPAGTGQPAGGSGQSGAASSGTLRAEAERGLAAFERGDYPEAIRIWERVRTARPSAGLERALAEAHFRRALATTSAANRARELQQAVTLAPNRAIYHLHLGLAHERQGQRERALGAYEAAQRLAPKDDRVRRQLALARLAEPVTVGAAAELLASAPKRDKTATRLRALAALRSGDPAAAITWLADVKSGGPLGNLALGLARLAAGEAEAAHEGLLKLARTRRVAAPVVDEEARRVAALGAAVAKLR